MIGTLFSLILGFVAAFQIYHGHQLNNIELMASLLTIVGIGFLFLTVLLNVLIMMPLQRAEADLTPKVVELFRKDRVVRLGNLWLTFFCLSCFFMAFLYDLINNPTILNYGLAGWFVALGFSADILRLLYERSIGYLSSADIMNMLVDQAKKQIDKGDDRAMLSWVDAITETALKALDRVSTSLAMESIDAMAHVMQHYLEVADENLKHSENVEQIKETIDQINYTLFYVFQRLENIYYEALSLSYEPVCCSVMTNLGKIAVFTAHIDLKMVSYPLHFVHKFARVAIEEDMKDIGIRASCTLQETAKVILEECDLLSGGFKELFVSIISNLSSLAKETFRKDKDISIAVLMAPFHDLKSTLQQESIKKHPDYTVVVQALEDTLDEFSALAHVMTNLPLAAEEKKSENLKSSEV